MGTLIAWVGKLLATTVGGPGIVVLGDPGLAAERDLPSGIGMALVALVGLLVVLVVAGIPGAVLFGVVLLITSARARTSRRGTSGAGPAQSASPASTDSRSGSRPAK